MATDLSHPQTLAQRSYAPTMQKENLQYPKLRAQQRCVAQMLNPHRIVA